MTNFNNQNLMSNPCVEASILSAQYNNKAITPGQLAAIRGSGQFSTTGGLSSNWTPGDVNPKSSTYVEKLGPGVIPHNSLGYDTTIGVSPVGEFKNDEFYYTPDQSSFPPGSKTSLQGDPYLQFALQAVKETPTAINTLFFSAPNVKYIHKRLLEDIHQLTGVRLKPQSENVIMITMINKYQYSEEGYLPSTSVVHLALPIGPKSCSLKDRLSRLNQATLQELVKQILSGMSMYTKYYKDISSMPMPLSRPTLATMKGSKVIPFGNVGMYENGKNVARDIQSFNVRNNVIN